MIYDIRNIQKQTPNKQKLQAELKHNRIDDIKFRFTCIVKADCLHATRNIRTLEGRITFK